MCKNYCFVKITLSVNYWSGKKWFANDVIGISNSKQDWNILVCPLARGSHGVVKINIQNRPISLGTKCFVYKRRVFSVFVPTLFLKYGRHLGDNLTFSVRPIQISFARATGRVLIYIPACGYKELIFIPQSIPRKKFTICLYETPVIRRNSFLWSG